MNRGRFGSVLLLTFSVAVLLSVGSCGTANLTPINNACICPGDMLQFNCTAEGSGVTIWTGTTFSRIVCTPISLNHIQFQDLINRGQSRFCPGMTIIVRPLSVVNDCYTSQLTLPSVTAEFNGSTVTCQHDTVQTNEIGTYTIMYTTEPFPPPNNVSLTAISNNYLTFTWENVAPTCRSLTYGIKSSAGCGICPTIAHSTSVVCSGVRLRGGVETCTISVQAITCGNIPGSYSQPLSIELQVPPGVSTTPAQPTTTMPPQPLPAPVNVRAFCSHAVWRIPPGVPCNDILRYEIRLSNSKLNKTDIRQAAADGTFYFLDEDDEYSHEATTFEVRVITSNGQGLPSQPIPLGCSPAEEPPSVYFELKGKVYANNSFVNIDDIGEDDEALLCKTDKVECCGTRPNRFGQFYYPLGAQVPIKKAGQGFYRDRDEQQIRLNRRRGAMTPTGVYRCEIPDSSGVMQNVFINIG